MNKALKVLVILPAILFLSMGVRWLVAPAGIAPDFGLGLEQGLGLSSQVGDMSGYFLALGLSMLMAVYTGRRDWYYPPILLLSLTAVGRIVSWLVHDAALAVEMIIPEVVVSLILYVASRRLPEPR